MKTRIIVGIALVGIFLLLFLGGSYVQMALMSAAALISVYEMSGILKAKKKEHAFSGAYVFSALCYGVLYFFGGKGFWILLGLSLLFSFLEWKLRKLQPKADLLFSLFLYIYPLALYAILDLILLSGKRTAFLLVFAGPLLGDTLAYFIGTFFGKHKLCPKISPKKTVEGSAAGFLGGLLAGLFVFLLQPLWKEDYRLLTLLVTGFLCGGFGQAGDLWASMIKRWAGVKDYGKLFPGHGGVMDRLDSVLFCAPVIFVALLLG